MIRFLARCTARSVLLACAGPALLAAAESKAAAPPARLAWLQQHQVVAVQREGAAAVPVATSLRTPLGSIWKLFVYAYLNDNDLHEPAYRCELVQREIDDEYCCDPGASIGRDEALARSCGPYFAPARLGIVAADWSRHWAAADAPPWLRQLSRLRPDGDVPVADLLQALASVPPAARVAARRALLPVSVRDDVVLAAFGSGPRFKTWSWHVGGDNVGGAAGWLADGTPFWFGAAGASRSALRGHAGWIEAQWQAHGRADARDDAATRDAQPCIDVDFFSRYPIRSLTRGDGRVAPAGALLGRHVAYFRNGSRLRFEATAPMRASIGADGVRLDARLPLEDYVARVVDREGNATETHAARALAVAARTYALQNAAEGEGCRRMADHSRTQRVSPSPPSAAARAAAAFTEDIVVHGAPVRYHADTAGPNVMSWRAAVAASRSGDGFEAILRHAYQGSSLGGWQDGSDCEPMPQAVRWLGERQRRWRELLSGEVGYEPPGEGVQVCQLAYGTPHSDQRRLLIRVRDWQSREGRVTLIHEYLHLAFRHHPRGQDEAYVERWAQRLADL